LINLRKYGNEPYSVIVIHGGPGAPGTVAPVARELSKSYGVLEPLQTVATIEGQVSELKRILDNYTNAPVVIIGHSWGAWLSYIFAARYPQYIKKLILVGCGSFEDKYLSYMNSKRVNRLTEDENKRAGELMELLENSKDDNRKEAFIEFGKLMSKTDSYAPITLEKEILDFEPHIYRKCMEDLIPMRRSLELLNMGRNIECPVIAIHGEYDPHSYKGVQIPLTCIIKDFKFFLLKDCGHNPWNEVYAKDKFYEIIYNELGL
jgi:pimeloyl-ACP methyl ester carboxylesterase